MTRLPTEQYQKYGDDLAPNFSLNISGQDASEATALFNAIKPLISGVSFEDDEEMCSMLTLNLINQPDVQIGRPVNWQAVIDSKAFAEGNTIDLYMGYGSDRKFMDRLEIVKWMPRFPEDGPLTLTIKAFDGRHRMTIGNQFKVKGGKSQKKRKTSYRNLTHDAIVKKIAEKYGYGVDTEVPESKQKSVSRKDKTTQKIVKTKVYPTRIQGTDVNDWQFLQKLAELDRFDLWVDWDIKKKQHVVHYKKRKDSGAPEYLFEYGSTLLFAEPDFSITDQPTDVEVLYFDRKRRVIERTIISDTTPAENVKLSGGRVGMSQMAAKKEIKVGARVRFSAFGQVLEAYSDKPFKSKREATHFVQNWLKERERDFLLLSGRVVGVPTLRSRQIHEIGGLGKRINGPYRFTNVKHDMMPGRIYSCEFTAHKVLSKEIARRAPTTKVQATTGAQQQAG